MSKFREWYVQHQDAITWFLVGLLTSGMIEQLAKANYGLAVLSAVLIWANYKMLDYKIK
jgi:phage tail protein X